ncbi:aldo/keto reductase [Elongatibacter sediminis]|uniref:Aldo/keto reductase n=1 Tax=Elongatibacter sediminis TaxID=3119006 RepID=A0AAW9R919_9GAMM
MRYQPLGSSGIEASVVGFGAWAIGGLWWGGADEAESISAIHAALDAGINLIDTAPIYGFGRSEALIGKAIAGRRESVVIASKCGMRWDGVESGQFHVEAPVPGSKDSVKIYRDLKPATIRREIEVSLERLGTDYIDLYQTHWQDDTTPVEDTMACLLDLQAQGKIRAIGVSNASSDHMDAYRRFGAIHSDQERYSMLDQGSAKANLEYCRAHDLALLAYSPLAHGLLTGKVDLGRQFAEGDFRRGHADFTPEKIRSIQSLLRRLEPVAADNGLTLAQLAIRWTVQQPGCTHALCGARNAGQASANAHAGESLLDAASMETIALALDEYAVGNPSG